MTRVLARLGHFSARHPWRVVLAWVAIAIAVIGFSVAFGADPEDSFSAPGVDSAIAHDLLEQAGSTRAGVTARVVLATPDGAATDEADRALVRLELAALPHVVGVDETVAPEPDVVLYSVQYEVLSELSSADLDRLDAAITDLRVQTGALVESGGELYFAYAEPESGNGELMGLGAAVVILLLAFGSIVAMGLPIGTALFGLGVGLAALPLLGHVVGIPTWASGMASMIGLGVGIDYALFLVTRYREFLTQGLSVPDAAAKAVATAGQSVVFAGGTVIIAILGLAVAGLPFLTAMAVATALVVALMVAASITLLPAFFGLLGGWVNRLGLHRRGHTVASGASPGWRRWGAHVSRHAAAYAVGGAVFLLGLASPLLALRLGFPDEGTQPESRTERRAYDLVADAFGPGINGPLLIAVDLHDLPAGTVAADVVAGLAEAVAADPGVAAVAPAEVAAAGDVATVIALPTTAPQAEATYETVQRLRAEVFPAALDGTGVTAHIGGQTANFGDVADRVSGRIVLFISAVVLLSFLLLTVVFRSLVVPLKAAVMNLLSIGASYGVLVMVFQWGWGKGLLGLDATVPVVSFVPLFMFAVLFGLSMDYEVFLLSRVREEYVAGGDNEQSVITGLAGTGRVITSAALIMIFVFGAFVLGSDPVVKMMGVGLATAVLVDATIVRCVLVPATMKLMGRANWWLPGWLDRRLPHVDVA